MHAYCSPESLNFELNAVAHVLLLKCFRFAFVFGMKTKTLLKSVNEYVSKEGHGDTSKSYDILRY